jgi:phage repressor protein C with HTH and peptisase S24 domain
MHSPASVFGMETVGDRVKAEREHRGWTQSELARRVVRAGFATMSQGGIAQIERRGDTEPKSIVQLASALGVSVRWLQTGKGDKRAGAPFITLDEADSILVPVRSFVGAGDEIFPIDEDSPIDRVAAPPGMIDAEATEVRGRSMLPLYHHGDLLFHHRIESDPTRFRDEVVIAQVKNGKRYVKLLATGTRRGRFNLVSINPTFAPLENQILDWVGAIEWVQKRRRG